MRVYESYSAGIIYRLAVSMPPRAGKSYISSLFIAWMLGHFPEESVMRNCCSDTLYNKLSYDARDIVKSKRFHEIFPDIYLKGDKQNVKSWNVEEPVRFLILAVVLVELLSVLVRPCSP